MSSKNVLIVTCGVCGQELGRAEGDAALVTHGLCNCAPPEMIEESADEEWITVRWSDGTEERVARSRLCNPDGTPYTG